MQNEVFKQWPFNYEPFAVADLRKLSFQDLKLTLHIDQTSLSFPLRAEAAKELNTSLQQLLQTFAAKQKAERPQRWKSMEFRLKGATTTKGHSTGPFYSSATIHSVIGPPAKGDRTACYAGDTANEEVEYLEIFCNPNSASTAFDAKALITLKTSQGVQVSESALHPSG